MMFTQLLTQFSKADAKCVETFFTLKPWFYYLETDDATCSIQDFKVLDPINGTSDFGLIALAIIDDMLRIGGMVAVAFIIYGGILYINSQGSPDQTAKAQSTIQNALIGLVICIIAVGFVGFLGNRFGS